MLIDPACIVTMNIDFGEDGEIDIVILLSKVKDFAVCSRLLPSKLVAWKRQHAEPFGFKVILEADQLSVVLIRVATLTSHVDDKCDLQVCVLKNQKHCYIAIP